MKVVENNLKRKTKFPVKITCEKCGSILEIDKEDVFYGYLGLSYVKCPVCGEKTETYLDDLDIHVTRDNVVFPDHFYYFKGIPEEEVDSEEVKEEIKKLIKYIKEHNEETFESWSSSANRFVFVHAYPGDECYAVTVANGYYDTEIPFDEEDYKIDWKYNEDE